jgi:hypothetical protein
VAEEVRGLEPTEEEDGGGRREAQDAAEQGRFEVAVFWVTFVVFVRGVVGRKVAQQALLVEGTSNCILCGKEKEERVLAN